MTSKLCTTVSRLSFPLSVSRLRFSYRHKYVFSELRTIGLFTNNVHLRWKSGKDDLSSIVIPVPVTPANNVDDISVGEELSKKINKGRYRDSDLIYTFIHC